MTEKKGITIDYCPECRGVWLDKGELEKLEGMASSMQNSNAPFAGSNNQYQQSQPHTYHDDDDHHQYNHGKPHKKESWLGEVFDF
jgi:uncharacterized protein